MTSRDPDPDPPGEPGEPGGSLFGRASDGRGPTDQPPIEPVPIEPVDEHGLTDGATRAAAERAVAAAAGPAGFELPTAGTAPTQAARGADAFDDELRRLFDEPPPAAPARGDDALLEELGQPQPVRGQAPVELDRLSLWDRIGGGPSSGSAPRATWIAIGAVIVAVLLVGLLALRRGSSDDVAVDTGATTAGTLGLRHGSTPGTVAIEDPDTIPDDTLDIAPPIPTPRRAGTTVRPAAATTVAPAKKPASTSTSTSSTTTTTEAPAPTEPPAPTTEAPTTAPPATEPRVPVTAFLDDFAGETPGQPASHWVSVRGGWVVAEDGTTKVLRSAGDGVPKNVAVTGADSWTQYEADVQLRLAAPTASAGIAAMYQPDGGHYFCGVDGSGGQLLLDIVRDGQVQHVGVTAYAIPADAHVHVNMTVRDGKLTCRGLDDPNAPALDSTDATWASGKLGVVTRGPADVSRVEVKA